MTLRSPFIPSVTKALCALAGLAIVASMVIVGVTYASARHTARLADQRVCTYRLQALLATIPELRDWRRPKNACDAVAILTGEGIR